MNPGGNQVVHGDIVVWDAATTPDDTPGVILWRSHGSTGDAGRSVPRYLEAHAESLRSRYLAWIHDLGEGTLRGRSVRDRLQLRPGLSFWWMALLAEKSMYTSPQLVNAVKLLALEELLGGSWRGQLTLVSADADLARAIAAWCRRKRLHFAWRRLPAAAGVPLVRRMRRWVPQIVQAAVQLVRHLAGRRPLARAVPRAARTADVTFCSYLVNFDRDAAQAGQYKTVFWRGLPELMTARGVDFNWLLQYFANEHVPDGRAARAIIDRLDGAEDKPGRIDTFDGALDLAAVAAGIRDYARMLVASLRMYGVRRLFTPAGSQLDFWPLFADDWRRSLRGADAIQSCLIQNCIERTLRTLPKQRLGLYLQENIGWEQGLVHAWKAAGHGVLVGVPHSTVRFWDLRYFFDARSYTRTGGNDLPMPDFVALNGPANQREYLTAAYPPALMAPVEALRYQYLADRRPVARPAKDPASPLRVLVLGDYILDATLNQMRWLGVAARSLPAGTRLVVKPHPVCPVRAQDFPELAIEMSDQPVEKLLPDCDVAFVSNGTSAGVDAYCAGVPVVSVLDGETFNFSPLRGLAGVEFVGSAEELAPALERAAAAPATGGIDFFFLDRELPRWRRLIGIQP